MRLSTVAGLAASGLALGSGGAMGGPCGNPTHTGHGAHLLSVSNAEAVAVRSGLWSDAGTWGGRVPLDFDDVYIPAGVSVTYDVASSVRLGVVRIEGHLGWAVNRSTRMLVDTLLTTGAGVIEIGTEASPIPASHTAEVIFRSDRPIDTVADASQLGRGILTNGSVRIVGAEKVDFVAIQGDALAGSRELVLRLPAGMSTPAGWRVGDKLVLTGTSTDDAGSHANNSKTRDEVLTIRSISGNRVTFTNDDTGLDRLRFDHRRPDGATFDPGELSIYVANLTRNVVLRSEGGPSTPVNARGHAMFMHSMDVRVINAQFKDLGRADKTRLVDDVGSNFDGRPGLGTNPRGRYGLHFHRNMGPNAAVIDFASCAPAVARGNVVWGSPGWGLVHHQSYATLEDNVVFDVVGSGIVAEAGDEVGQWRRNIVIKTTGDAAVEADFDGSTRVTNYDFGFNGEGYWIQGGPRIDMVGNIAVSNAYAGALLLGHVDGNLNRDGRVIPVEHLRPELRPIITNGRTIDVSHVPMEMMDGFEVYNSELGLVTWHHNRKDSGMTDFVCPCDNNVHREITRITNFKLWNIRGEGVFMQYTQLVDLDNGLVVGDISAPRPFVRGINGNGRGHGVSMNDHTNRLIVQNLRVEGFAHALRAPRGGLWSVTNSNAPFAPSVFRNIRMANVDLAFSANGTGFQSEVERIGEYHQLEGVTRVDGAPLTNIPPVAVADWDATGAQGVVRFDASASWDQDAVVASNAREASFSGIVAYGWDLNSDGTIDRWGRQISERVPLPWPREVTLTVWDQHNTATSTTITVNPRGTLAGEMVRNGNFASAAFAADVGRFDSTQANSGWVGGSMQVINGSARMMGRTTDNRAGFGQVMYSGKAARGPHKLTFLAANTEGTASSPVMRNTLTVAVYGLNGEFRAENYFGGPSPIGAVPMLDTNLLEAQLTAGSFSNRRFTYTVDLGHEGYEFVYIAFRGTGILASTGDVVRFDDVSFTDLSTCGLADWDGSTRLDVFDVMAYMNDFGGRNPVADVTGDGSLSVFDVIAFMDEYALGCSN